MNKLEKAHELDYLFSKNQFDSTNTEAAKLFENNNKTKVALIVATGLVSLTPNLSLRAEIKIQKENRLSIENYEENVSINDYLKDINSIIIKKNYDKKDILKKIFSFKMLNENWDGFGAYPLEAETAANAIELLDMIGEELFSKVNDIYPNPNGTLTFEWNNNAGEIFALEIGNNEVSYFLEMTPEETIYKNNIPVNVSEAEKIAEYIRYI